VFGTYVGFMAAAFSADGKVLATSSGDALRIWEVDTGQEVRSWQGHHFGADAVTLTADGQVLVSKSAARVGRDLAVRVWDARTGKLRHEFPCGQNWQAVCLSPSGHQVAILNGEAHTITVWDLKSGERVRQFLTVRDSNEGRLDFHPDGKSLFVTSMGDRGGLRRYDAVTGTDLGMVVAQEEILGPKAVAVSKDFAVVATITGNDGVVRFWDLGTGKVKGTVTPGDKRLWAIALSPDGKVLATQAQGRKPSFVFWKAPD
jgi:WD40 repeat protein